MAVTAGLDKLKKEGVSSSGQIWLFHIFAAGSFRSEVRVVGRCHVV